MEPRPPPPGSGANRLQSAPVTDASASPAMPTRRLLAQTALVGGLALVAMAIAGAVFRQPLLAVSATFVRTLGGPGVLVGWWFCDSMPVPVVPDAFSAVALAGGMSFWTICAWAGVGTLLGGTTGFVIGRTLSHTPAYKRVMDGRGAEARRLVERYGITAIAVAALTPLPYSLASWAAGALGMGFGPFFAVSLLRAARVVSHLWLIRLGLINVLG